MELAVYNIKGEDTGRKISLDDSIFGIEPNEHAVYLDVKHYLAAQRQGTHKSKERNEIKGSTKKIKKQKGTGSARAGSIKSPLFVGGGRIFGPRPRDYDFKLNKKVKKLARKSALSAKAKEQLLWVIEDFSFEKPRTKSFVELLKNFNLQDKKSLFVLAEPDANVVLSGRNLKNAKVSHADSLNTYDVLRYENLILSEGSLEQIKSILN
ncbi:MAG: 50S ribosomal protein L4 [Cyclobacteriaceae bacterium]|nr:50S ribosomal protein L4 [Cyclobacteriaceae bacterium]